MELVGDVDGGAALHGHVEHLDVIIHHHNMCRSASICVLVDSTDYMHPPTVVLDLEKVYTFDKKQEDDLILKYNPISVIRSNSLHKGNNANELVNEEKYLIRCTNKYLLKNKNIFSLPISIVFN